MSGHQESQETHAENVGGAAKKVRESSRKPSTFTAESDTVTVRYEALLRLLFGPDATPAPDRQDAA